MNKLNVNDKWKTTNINIITKEKALGFDRKQTE